MDYSSLFLPALLTKEGCGPQLQVACLKCLVAARGQGFKHLLLYCTLPHVFPVLQVITLLHGGGGRGSPYTQDKSMLACGRACDDDVEHTSR